MIVYGELAQLGEHLPCTQGVKGSNPLFSTTDLYRKIRMYLENRTKCESKMHHREEIENINISIAIW